MDAIDQHRFKRTIPSNEHLTRKSHGVFRIGDNSPSSRCAAIPPARSPLCLLICAHHNVTSLVLRRCMVTRNLQPGLQVQRRPTKHAVYRVCRADRCQRSQSPEQMQRDSLGNSATRQSPVEPKVTVHWVGPRLLVQIVPLNESSRLSRGNGRNMTQYI